MRPVGAALLLALVLAGCAAPASPSPGGPTPTTPEAQLPQAIHDTKDVPASLDPAGVPACSQVTTQCFHHAFDVAANATLNATLSWGNDRNDFDLYLFKGDVEVASSKGNSGSTERVAARLEPGKYDLVVGGSTVAADTYKLDAVFAAG